MILLVTRLQILSSEVAILLLVSRQSIHSDLEGESMQDGAPPASPKALSRAAGKQAQAAADRQATSSKQFSLSEDSNNYD